MTRARTWWLASSVLILAILVNWWIAQLGDDDRDAASRPAPPFDYALTDFDAVLYDEAGQRTLRVEGPRLEHDPETRTAHLLQPLFELPAADALWTGRSERGRLARNEDRLELEGDVVLSRPHPGGRIRIESRRLDYDRRESTLTSPGTVRITQAGTELVGGTLKYLLNDDRVELQNDVHAIYRDAANGGAEHSGDPRTGRGMDNRSGPAG